MHSPRNPTRRNRNIGTAKQGHGRNNSLVIPDRLGRRSWLELVGKCQVEDRQIAGRTIRFVVEDSALDCRHACNVSDVGHILEALPQDDWVGLETFVFRQPTRKQLALSPVWGRLLYHAEVTTAKGQVLARGPTVFLDAPAIGSPMVWSTSLDPEDSLELERLKIDGHEVLRSGKKYTISVSAESARNTQLYRTLLHEVGHWNDWLSKVERPASMGGNWDELEAAYFARPRSEREAFAHRYADAQRARLEADKVIPFQQIR